MIRKANLEDSPEIAGLVNAAFHVEKEFRIGPRTSVGEVSRLMASGTFFVAVQGSRIVGAIYIRTGEKSAYLGMLAVDPDLQGSGVGRTLLDTVEEHARSNGCRVITLSTGSFRRELLGYYGRRGYLVTSVEPAPPDAPFAKPIDIVKMAKKF